MSELNLGNQERRVFIALYRVEKGFNRLTSESKGATWSEIRNCDDKISNEDSDLNVGRSLKRLKEKGLVKKVDVENAKRWYIPSSYESLARRENDIKCLEVYSEDDLSALSTSKPLTSISIYGLDKEAVKESSEEEEATKQIKAHELMGKFYGAPFSTDSFDSDVKRNQYRGEKLERDIIRQEIKSFMEMKKEKDLSVEELLFHVIKYHREETIQLDNLGANIVAKLSNIGRQYGLEKFGDKYSSSLQNESLDSEVEKVLKEFKEEFIEILESHNPLLIKQSLAASIFHSYGRAYNEPFDIDATKSNNERFNKFKTSVDSLGTEIDFESGENVTPLDLDGIGEEQRELIDFLVEVFNQNKDCFPKKPMFLARQGDLRFGDISHNPEDIVNSMRD